MSERFEEYLEDRRSWRDEYDKLLQHWRFLQGIRTASLFGLVAALAALLGAYRVFAVSIARGDSAEVEKYILITLPIVAMTAIHVTMIIERIMERMLDGLIRRGSVLETFLSIRRGIFHDAALSVTVASPGLTISQIILALLLLAYLFWGMFEFGAILIAARLIH